MSVLLFLVSAVAVSFIVFRQVIVFLTDTVPPCTLPVDRPSVLFFRTASNMFALCGFMSTILGRCVMFLGKAFEVGKCYGTLSPCNPLECYLYVLKTVDQAGTRRAVFGVMFDSSYRIISKRWFRAFERGSYFYVVGTNVTFLSSLNFSENDPCFPPDVVLDFFVQAPGGVCA